MSILEKITSGPVKKSILALIYGVDGCGKSTWAASAPNPIFLGKEDGTNFLNVSRLPEPQSFQDVLQSISELISEKHPYKSLVIDSLDWIEPLIWKEVCEENKWANMEEAGYGKAYTLANQKHIKFIHGLGALRPKMNIILIAHSQVKVFNDPSQSAPYDRYQLKLNDKASALYREFVDFVGFATYEIYTKNVKEGQKTKAFGEGKRVLYTERRPSFDAKSRFQIPFELPLSYAEFEKYAQKNDSTAEIKDLLSRVDEVTRKKAEEALKNPEKTEAVIKRLREVASGITK